MIDLEAKDQWKISKWGKFSASEEWKLTIGAKKPDPKTGVKDLFGDGAMSYIRRVAREAYTLYNEEENAETYQMKMGKLREPGSFAYLEQVLGRRDVLTYYGGLNPIFHLYTPDSGCSPDSVAWKDYGAKIASFGAELKNPSGDVHWDYLMNIKDQASLKDYSIEYWVQCQKAMMTFKCDLWLWCSHNEYFPGKDRLLIIQVQQDKNFQNDLDARIAAATKKKYEFIEQLKNRQ